jgi:regulatory protein
VHEMESRLMRLGFGVEAVGRTTEWLLERGYLDDRRYVERYVAEKLRVGWAGRRISGELLRQGLDRGLVDEIATTALEDEEPGAARFEVLTDTVRRRFGPQFRADPKAAERRMAGFLARRGYDWETIDRLARRLRDECAREDGSIIENGD